MKFRTEIEINKSLETVISAFDNPDNLKKWQAELISFEHISGIPGQPGAKSRLRYKTGKREVIMIETITVRNLPEEFSGTYEAAGVFNVIKNSFIAIDENRTKYIADHEFRFKGMMLLIGWMMGGIFKKQTMKYLMQFKYFVENN